MMIWLCKSDSEMIITVMKTAKDDEKNDLAIAMVITVVMIVIMIIIVVKCGRHKTCLQKINLVKKQRR